MTTQRPDPSEHLESYGKYIALVPDGDILATLRSQIGETVTLLTGVSEERALFRYADGKWSIKELVGHVTDTERIFSYRALCVARNDQTPLPGFAEDEYVGNAFFDSTELARIVGELQDVRTATLSLFGNLHPDAWMRVGNANGADISVRALAWITAGHEIHHMNILRERYLA